MSQSVFFVRPDHPALAGHFPGNPVVPGVVVLNEVIRTLRLHAGDEWKVRGFPLVKFLRPLAPGQPCTIEFSRKNPTLIQFVCRSRGEIVATGQLCGDPE